MNTDVVIVGGGPVGMTLSIALSHLGLRNIVVEREAGVFPLPRAIVMDAEIHRSLLRLGLGKQLEPCLTPMHAADFVDSAGSQLMGIELTGIRLFGVPAVSRHYQPELESMLRDEAARRGATLVFGRSVARIAQSDDSVCVTCDDGSQITAPWMVGCDGASSFVRKTSDIELEDLGFDQDWLVVDLLVPDKVSAGLPDVTRQVCDRLRPTTLVNGHREYYRFEFQLQPSEDPSRMRESDVVWQLLKPWISKEKAEIVRIATYRFHAVVAREMRNRRVFIAGDAAHQMPPFMGQGLNSGMRDALNLSWKLALVAQGSARETLLDTYALERIPHARGTVAESVETGRLIDQLAGRTSHGVSANAGYGGSRRSLAFTKGVVIGSNPGVGAPFSALDSLPDEPRAVFFAVSHRDVSFEIVDALLFHLKVDDSVALSDEVVFVRPDGYVAATCTFDQMRDVWLQLKHVAQLSRG